MIYSLRNSYLPNLTLNLFVFLVLAVALFVFGLSDFVGFRYLKYSSLFLFPIYYYFIAYSRLRINKAVLPFLLIITATALKVHQYNQRGIEEVVFILSGIVLFIAYNERTRVILRSFFLLSFVILAVIIVIYGQFNNNLFSILMNGFTSNIEGNVSFVVGFSSLFFFIEKKHSYTVISVIILLFVLKRIILLGLLAVFICYLLPSRLRKVILDYRFMLLLNGLFLLLTIQLSRGVWDDFIWNTFDISPNWLTMGRTYIYGSILEFISFNEVGVWIFGIGQGATSNILNVDGVGHLLHNDSFKLFLEHGILVWILFFVLLYISANEKQKYLVLFFNVLVLTDNVLIYPICYILFLAIYLHFNDSIKTDECLYQEKTQI